MALLTAGVFFALSAGPLGCHDVTIYDPFAEGMTFAEAQEAAADWLDSRGDRFLCPLWTTDLENDGTRAYAFYREPAPIAGPAFFVPGVGFAYLAFIFADLAWANRAARNQRLETND